MSVVNQLKGKITVIIVAHRLSTVSECNSLYQFENGECNKVQGEYCASVP